MIVPVNTHSVSFDTSETRSERLQTMQKDDVQKDISYRKVWFESGDLL